MSRKRPPRRASIPYLAWRLIRAIGLVDMPASVRNAGKRAHRTRLALARLQARA